MKNLHKKIIGGALVGVLSIAGVFPTSSNGLF